MVNSKYRDDGHGVFWDGTPEEKIEFDAWYARQEIFSKLSAIDTKSARPLRAISAGTATQVDRDYLASLEQEAATLRAQL